MSAKTVNGRVLLDRPTMLMYLGAAGWIVDPERFKIFKDGTYKVHIDTTRWNGEHVWYSNREPAVQALTEHMLKHGYVLHVAGSRSGAFVEMHLTKRDYAAELEAEQRQKVYNDTFKREAGINAAMGSYGPIGHKCWITAEDYRGYYHHFASWDTFSVVLYTNGSSSVVLAPVNYRMQDSPDNAPVGLLLDKRDIEIVPVAPNTRLGLIPKTTPNVVEKYDIDCKTSGGIGYINVEMAYPMPSDEYRHGLNVHCSRIYEDGPDGKTTFKWECGVNWAATGTRTPDETYRYIYLLQTAAATARVLQNKLNDMEQRRTIVD